MLLYLYAAAVGFSLGIGGRPLASAAWLQFERWRGNRAWKRLSQTMPSIKWARPECPDFDSRHAEVERIKAKVGGRQDVAPVSLRVTSIFRNEDGAWKLVHRHADPITSAQSAESVIQT